MKKELLGLLLMSTIASYAQNQFHLSPLGDDIFGKAKLQRIAKNAHENINKAQVAKVAPKGSNTKKVNQETEGNLNCLLVKCKDANAIGEIIKQDGFQATVITSNLVTVRVDDKETAKLYLLRDIEDIQPADTYYGLMDKAREDIGVERLHAGEGLETPYTGKGVIIGIIDQGFEYRHLAFLDAEGNPRTKVVWDRTGYSKGKSSEPTTDIPFQGDNLGSDGHATHVTGIAAGSKIADNDYYGIAPDADIIMIPSTFNGNEILEDVKFIDEYAKKHNQPWVINMSFGTTLGAHDGKEYTSKALNDIVADGNGHQIVVAGGNSGMDKIHATHTFTRQDEVVRYIYNTGSYGVYSQIWCNTADSAKHIKVQPFLYYDKTRDYQEGLDWSQYMVEEIAPYNKKQNFTIGVAKEGLTGCFLGVEITGDPGTTIHIWNSSYYGSIADAVSDEYSSGDDEMSLSTGPACAKDIVTVASYVTRDQFTNQSGSLRKFKYGQPGEISSFSSHGPCLGPEPKPTVAAPGSMIIAPISKYNSGFNASSPYVVQDIKKGLRHFYYAANAGTSMASPVVTGTIALWLQANPNLTSQQISDIIKETSRKADSMGDAEWDKYFGYGKIDAYEGLKKALLLASSTGIPTVIDTESPITISKEADRWRILFNSDEHYANIKVCDASGRIIKSEQIKDILRGTEHTLSMSSLNKGIYIVTVETAKNKTTRKFACM